MPLFDQVFDCMVSIVFILDRMLALLHTLCSTCHKLNESFVYVRVFQVTSINYKCFTVFRLGVSEFCHCSQTHIIDNEMRNQLQRKKHSDITFTSIK